MNDRRREVWAVTNFDTRAHLYFEESGAVRRLCHRSRFTSCDPVAAEEFEQCKLCMNIRGKIVTRRHTEQRRAGKKLGDPA